MSAAAAIGALGLGAWDEVVRQVARYDYEQAQRVASWPANEVLHAHVAAMREHAGQAYRHRMLVWAPLAVRQKDPRPPKPPAILDEE